MDTANVINKARAYLSTQMHSVRARQGARTPAPVFVTISRESGAGGLLVAEYLAEALNRRGIGAAGVPWTVFEKNLLEKVVEDNELPQSYMDQMEEKAMPAVQTAVSELLAVHPSISRLVAMTSRTVLHLANMGNSILVGRAANVLTGSLEVGLHVRLIAPPERRLEFLMDHYVLNEQEAAKRMAHEDEGRAYYVRRHFNRDVDDPLLYDMVLNTHRLGHRAAAELTAEALEIKVRNQAT